MGARVAQGPYDAARRALTFNRPDRLNALSTPIMEGLLETLPRLARDAAVVVIVPAWWGRE
jgi:enoyl-CoA hydratase/carnithine racemase